MTTRQKYSKLQNKISKEGRKSFFLIKMVLLIFTAIIEAQKHIFFFSYLKVPLDLKSNSSKYLENVHTYLPIPSLFSVKVARKYLYISKDKLQAEDFGANKINNLVQEPNRPIMHLALTLIPAEVSVQID